MSSPLAKSHPTLITRTDVIHVRNCAGYAWLTKYQPHRVPAEALQATLRKETARQQVIACACELFPGSIVVPTDDPVAATRLTADAVANGAGVIQGATVMSDHGLVATADFLVREGDGWALHDVRATTGIRTEHIVDTGYVAEVFASCGYSITHVQIIALRKAFTRRGFVSAHDLCQVVDVTARVQRQAQRIAREMEVAVAALTDCETPAICLCDMGTRIQRCPTFDQFHPYTPRGGTIYDLGSVSAELIGQALERGVLHIVDWPDDIQVTPRQRLQIEMARSGEERVERDQLARFVGQLRYPIHFLDYETFQTAIPLWEGSRPWTHLPFQYSVHRLDQRGALTAHQYLWRQRDQLLLPDLIDSLRHDIGPEGSVVVWNRGFEGSRNRDLAELFPEHAEFLLGLNERMVDLMDVVRQGMWLHPEFNGSASIKKVLPVAAPDLGYDLLEIGDGGRASERWFDAVMGDPALMTDRERAKLMFALEQYCHLDTLAMVRILDYLRDLLAKDGP